MKWDGQVAWGPRRTRWSLAAAATKSLQSCRTLCDPIDGAPPGSSVHGIFQARTLEWVAISFSNAWKWKVKVKLLSHVWLLETPWTAAYQAPPSMGFSRQEYWSGVPLPSPNWQWGRWSKCELRTDWGGQYWGRGVGTCALMNEPLWNVDGPQLLQSCWDPGVRNIVRFM